MAGFLLQGLLPEVGVQGRGAVGLFPAPALPAPGPALFQPVDDVLAVGAQPHLAGLLELAQRLDEGRQLHPVVGGRGVAAAELLFVDLAVKAVAQHRAPAAGTGVAAARAVGVNFNLFHASLLHHVCSTYYLEPFWPVCQGEGHNLPPPGPSLELTKEARNTILVATKCV